MKIFLQIILTALLTAGGILSATEHSRRNKKVLSEVWNEVSQRHFENNFKEKYQVLYEKFKPAIMTAANDKALAFEINKLLNALEQSHIVLLPPLNSDASRTISAIAKNTSPRPQRNSNAGKNIPDVPADPGIYVAQSDDRICVIRVRKDSPAAKAGIKMGDIILSVNGVKIRPEIKLYAGWAILTRALLSGRPETTVEIEYLDSQNKKQKVKITRQVNGEKWFKFGVLPRSYSDFYATILPGNIGYVQFTDFTTPMLLRFRREITDRLRNIKALIIDMRGNIGGMLLYPPWLAAWCCPETINFGKLIMRNTPLQPKSFPQTECFKGPLAVLIDHDSYSCAEVFAAGMQDAKKARLFGTTTSGKCLPSIFLKLPSGFRLQTVTGNFIRTNGKAIENIGVKPDEKIILSIDSLRDGQDNVIEAAKKYLLSQIN